MLGGVDVGHMDLYILTRAEYVQDMQMVEKILKRAEAALEECELELEESELKLDQTEHECAQRQSALLHSAKVFCSPTVRSVGRNCVERLCFCVKMSYSPP